MSFLSKLFRRGLDNPALPITGKAIEQYFVTNPSSSGVSVNKDTILGSAAVWRATNLISSSIARLPIKIYKRKGETAREKDEWHPSYYLLNKRPNEWQTAYTFVQTLQSHCLLFGNGYAYIERNEVGTPTELVILDPTETTAAKENGRLIYVTKAGFEDRKLLPENVLHVKGLGYDGFAGHSVVDILKDTFGHDLALLKYGNKFFSQGSALNVVIELPYAFKDQEAVERFRNSWGSIHTGLDNSHKLAILENGAKASRLVASNEEAQFLQSREFDLKAIANVFGIPASYLMSNYNTSYGSLEAENKQFLNHTLGGWLAMWESELEGKMLTEVQKVRDSHFIEFERKAFESSDLNTTITALATQIDKGMLTINEARAILNYPPVDGGDEIKGLQPEPVQAPVVPPEAPVQEEDQNTEEVAKSLLHANVERLIKRISKDALAGKVALVQRHLGVFEEALAGIPNAAEISADFLTNLEEEISAVLPEQRQAILINLDERLFNQLWTKI